MAFVIPAVAKDKNLDVKQFAEDISMNGFLQSLVTLISAPVVIGFILLFVKIRKGITIKQYLGFNNPRFTSIIKWSLVAIGFICFSDALTYFLNKPIVPDIMVDMYKSSYFPPLLLLDVIIITPVLEELFFRGFLFEGLRNSRFKVTGTIIITSLAWSLLHSQYDVYGIFSIFLSGLLLGYSRVKSNSIYAPIAIHMVGNSIASMELIVKLIYFQS
ncbi:MAG: CPBP family intramembrane metalloprotease [Sedimentisphaerales bacterium]|nr:CPBP family intramembrane metalloprotease [Sedimentisphaerales bacterium]